MIFKCKIKLMNQVLTFRVNFILKVSEMGLILFGKFGELFNFR